MQRIWYKNKIPGVVKQKKDMIVLVDLFVNGIWLQKYVNLSDITDRSQSISQFVAQERKLWFTNYHKTI